MELEQYFKSASQSKNPIAIFDEHHNLIFNNHKFNQSLIKNVNSDFLVSTDSFLKKENLLYYTNKINNIYIVMVSQFGRDCYKELKDDFMNFKSSVVKTIASNICDKIKQNKRDIFQASQEFDECLLRNIIKRKTFNFYNILMLPFFLFLKH
jgi:hypothetical protein